MKKVHRLLIALFAIASMTLFHFRSEAQSYVTADISKQYTTFRFLDSNGNQDKDYNGVYSGGFSVGYRYNASSGFVFRGSIGMQEAGATLIYDGMSYSWNLSYASVRAGAGWMFGKGKWHPYATVAPYYARLLNAYQRLNNEDFDVKSAGYISSSDYGVEGCPGVLYELDSRIRIYAEMYYRYGLQNLEAEGDLMTGSASNQGQTSNNRAAGISLGLTYQISK
jgi:hypothetical protein